MDVFSIRNHMVADYGDYVTSFVSIREAGIREKVDAALEAGLLWPEPRVGINRPLSRGERSTISSTKESYTQSAGASSASVLTPAKSDPCTSIVIKTRPFGPPTRETATS